MLHKDVGKVHGIDSMTCGEYLWNFPNKEPNQIVVDGGGAKNYMNQTFSRVRSQETEFQSAYHFNVISKRVDVDK